MPLDSFAPNTKIESQKVNDNFTKLSNASRYINLHWLFPGSLSAQNSKQVFSLPANATWERVDLVVETPSVGQSIIADIERSTDEGATWNSIFTSPNRPTIAASSRTGTTISISNTDATARTHYFRAKVSQVGTTTKGTTLNVILRGKYDL